MKKLIQRSEITSSYMSEEELLREIENLKARGAKEIYLSLSHYWDTAEIQWEYKTLESDQEYEHRLDFEERENRRKAAATKKRQQKLIDKREKDRALYEKLKKEFEG
jgi:hypothetical protein